MIKVTPKQRIEINFINYLSQFDNLEIMKEEVHINVLELCELIFNDLNYISNTVKDQFYFLTEIAALFKTVTKDGMQLSIAEVICEELETSKQWGNFEDNCKGYQEILTKTAFEINCHTKDEVNSAYLRNKINFLYDLYSLFDLQNCIATKAELNLIKSD